MLPWTLLAAFRPIQTGTWPPLARSGAVRWSWLNTPSPCATRRTSGCDQSSVKAEKQSQRNEDREFCTSASSKRTDLSFCALTIGKSVTDGTFPTFVSQDSLGS